ncbi:hypothetical protein VHUM_00785 [Vanrija humicola]|uniref:ABC transporter domain-containing protein n=1 Tax=Vanrija humicola TaxID=5417 RepID=A0A7D8V4F3_VANHU|nr:hypothetical protein VHUM_00785 [Vanrija humicola]
MAVAGVRAGTERAGFGAIAKRDTASEELLALRGAAVPGIGFSNVSSELIPPRRPPADKDKCPPCFNCLLPAFNCGQFGDCNQYDGQCRCPPGFGGQDCLTPLCGSLKDGDARYPRPDGKLCDCNDGWGGINCNVCADDRACKGFKLRNPIDGTYDEPEGDEDDPSQQMVCYKGGLTVDRSFQMCDVTNRKIIDTIPDQKKPQVTFSCIAGGPQANVSSAINFGGLGSDFGMSTLDDKESMGTCGFQFWVDRIESFYCKLDQCQWYAEETPGANETHFNCEKIECACIPGRFLCGENGSVNIDDFLSEEVKGPGSFNCVSGQGCTFEEPAMNQLINDIFGDKAITLDCDSGECLHYSQVPGYSPPAPVDNSFFVALSAALALAIFAAAVLLLWYLGRARRKAPGFAGVKLPEDEAAKLMADHVPATLHFSNISYTLPKGRQVLSHVTGTVRPGEILAIMGASGAGKSTLLDILARKAKRGKVEGVTYVNGRQVDNAVFRRVSGFVDQEDTLLPTLTVYETVLYSALLRLPREMSYEAKVYRTLETMNELGILGIKDSRIGESGKRSISGGEKRRVSIACELVTGPSILFLDEPTSGLDSYNAYNVIDSLKTLAKQYRRTVIFTIHQPQSNIVALFDRLLVLARGQLVYSGEAVKAQDHFEAAGYVCPAGYNIADYIIDVTVEAAGDSRRGNGNGGNGGSSPGTDAPGHSRIDVERDAESGFARRSRTPADTGTSTPLPAVIQHKAARLLGLSSTPGASGFSTPTPGVALDSDGHPQVPEALAALVVANRAGDATKIVEAEITRIQSGETADGEERNVEDEFAELHIKGYKKAAFGTQFVLLSGRAFKNLYRNPLLMGTHYVVAVVVGLLCGFFFYHLTNDIPGFQNRLGLFLFILSLFGFSTLSSLGIFASERMLFMRERANGYYSAGAYFLSKVLFDIVPLRVIPPIVLGSIVYGLAGLNPDVASFWKFILVLVLFNLSAAAIVFFLSVAVPDAGVANLLGSLVMLYK